MRQIEMDGDIVVSWILRAEQTSLNLLIGSEYSDDESILVVRDIDDKTLTVCSEDNKKTYSRGLEHFRSGAFFISEENGSLLKSEIDATSSPLEKAREIVRAKGFSVLEFPSDASIQEFALALNNWESYEKVPDYDGWQSIINCFNGDAISITQKKIATVLFEKWLQHWELSIDGKYDVHHRGCLAALYRHSGQLNKALETSDCIELPKDKLVGSNTSFAVLCTTRAATFMDLVAGAPSHKSEYLQKARKLLNRAHATFGGGNNHTMMAYIRLKHMDANN